MSEGVAMEMPRYKCHKDVYALKIAKVEGCVITPENQRYALLDVGQAFIDKHAPVAGGYYVVYLDGYKSFSPAKAFEEGYTLIT